ncbi:MAG: cyclic nucleotide-binding domain-containing protein [Myxococcota bacterium]
MTDNLGPVWTEANRCLEARNPAQAICHLAELVSASPEDRQVRLSLAIALGDAGNPPGALNIMCVLAERLVHDGFMLPAIVLIRHGMHHAGDDPRLLNALRRLHVRGVRAKAGKLAVPPPLKSKKQALAAVKASDLLVMPLDDRLARVAQIGSELPPAGPAVMPEPMPLFCELDTDVFIGTVKILKYRRVAAGTRILEEGAPGDSLLIIVSGKVSISKAGTELCELGQASVLGEMALITKAPRSATATAVGQVEYFELGRAEVGELAVAEPKVLEELVEYCRRRLLLNLLRTSPLFTQFDEETRVQLLGRFQTVTLSDGEAAIMQGGTSAGLYIIASGEVEVTVASDDGGVVKVATLEPGDVFGEISLLHNTPATANVIAHKTVGALVLPAAEFQQVLQQYPQAREYLENLSADRLQASSDAATGLMLVDPDDIVIL